MRDEAFLWDDVPPPFGVDYPFADASDLSIV